jgi:hypothetical protein
MPKKPIPKVSKHAACVLVQRSDGVDVIDPMTGRWSHFPTMRQARWSATVYTRLSCAFGRAVADDATIHNTLITTK